MSMLESLFENWDELRQMLEEKPEDEQEAIKDHFNRLIEDEDDLGDQLFGDADDFESRIKFLDDNN